MEKTNGNWVYSRTGKYWHMLKTPEGMFFGYTRAEVFGKAKQAKKAKAA